MIIEELRSNVMCYQDPYYGIDFKYVDNGYPHTNLNHGVIENVLDNHNPTFWLEIGSMTGGSAIKTAQVVKNKGMATEIICIDPFVGDVNMWEWEHGLHMENKWQFLNLEEGFPSIKKRFLANVKNAGMEDIIFPVGTTSLIGLKLLLRLYKNKRISQRPQVIYLDSAHEEGETFLELKYSWELLEPGGVLFGDDWDWEAVRNDVSKFSESISKTPTLGANHWLLVKD